MNEAVNLSKRGKTEFAGIERETSTTQRGVGGKTNSGLLKKERSLTRFREKRAGRGRDWKMLGGLAELGQHKWRHREKGTTQERDENRNFNRWTVSVLNFKSTMRGLRSVLEKAAHV